MILHLVWFWVTFGGAAPPSSAVGYNVYNMVISNSKVQWSTIKLLTLSALFFHEIKIKITCLGLCKILPLTLHDEWYNALLNKFNYCKQCLLVVHSAYCSTGLRLRVIEISSFMFCRPCMVKVISKRCTTACLSVSPMQWQTSHQRRHHVCPSSCPAHHLLFRAKLTNW